MTQKQACHFFRRSSRKKYWPTSDKENWTCIKNIQVEEARKSIFFSSFYLALLQNDNKETQNYFWDYQVYVINLPVSHSVSIFMVKFTCIFISILCNSNQPKPENKY